MILWIFLTLAFTQITVGQEQEVSQQQQIRTAPIESPCLECLRNSEVDDQTPVCRCSQQREEGDGECGCCCCSTDNFQSDGNDGGPSLNVAMLAPLASIITSFMRGVGNNADQSVTFNFDDQTCSKDNEDQYTAGPQCEAPPYANETGNVSISTSPPTTPTTPPPSPVPTNSEPVGCQCRRKAKKGCSDIEEDSLYAIIQKTPAKKCSCSSSSQETSSVRVPSCNCQSSDVGSNPRIYSSNDIHQPSVQKDNLIQTQTTGNSVFDSISSSLSTWFSSPNNNRNAVTSNSEQNLMPCQCCC